LYEVYDLPVDFVVRAWLEEVYERYSDDDLRAEAVDLLRTPEELEAMKLREDEDDAYAFKAIREEVDAAKAIRKLEDAMKVLKKLPSVFKGGVGAEPEMTNVKPSKM
jgi:hypothetical protein